MAVIVEYRYSADHGRGCVGIHTFRMLRLCMDFLHILFSGFYVASLMVM